MFTVTEPQKLREAEKNVLKNKPLCLCVSVARRREWRRARLGVAIVMLWLSFASAQQLLDRVLARVDGAPITLTDVQAAIGLGIIPVGSGDAIAEGTQQMIDRELELTEVQRFPPPEPPPDTVAREVARLKMNAGPRLPMLMQSTGLTEQRITDMARDNLRIAGYLDQRFGTTVQVSDEEVAAYYRTHEAEFTNGGAIVPYEEAEPVARQRVSSERRRAIVNQWIRDLRSRADVAVNPPMSSGQGAGGRPQ
jgi:hypothetical protein